MLKSFILVHSGGQTTTNCAINSDAVLWLYASREQHIGKTTLSLMGNEAVAVTAQPAEVIETLGIQLVKLQRHDSAGRPGFDYEVYVSPATIRLVTRSNVGPFYTLEFVDGTSLDIADAGPLYHLTK